MNIFWLDDNPDRKPDAQNIEDATGIAVRFFDLKGKNLEQELANIVTKEKEPTLILLDQNLEDATEGVFKKGSTGAAYIKEMWPECPIVCVTGDEIENINNQQKALFEDILPISSISSYYDTIVSIASSFKIAKKERPRTINGIIRLLQVPESDISKIASILPTELKENISDNTLIIEISKWVRNILLKRPGFLYDRAWVATYLGIKQESFHKVEYLFEDAKYKGIFFSRSDERWWKSKVIDILYEKSDLPGLPWESGRGLPGVEPEDFSSCYVTNEPFPETVAFTDTTHNSNCFPMRLKNTVLHPEYESMLHFDNIRLMKPAE